MTGVVVDTDVISFLFKRDTRAELYRAHLSQRMLGVSFMTIAELDRWALKKRWGERQRLKMEEHLRNFVVIPYTRDLCKKWAEVTDGAESRGRPIQTADAWIAATALLYGIPLVTHNAADYAGVAGLSIISETPKS